MIRIQGWDLSLNHAGIVELVDGELSQFWYITSKVTLRKILKGHHITLPFPKKPKEKHLFDSQLFNVLRLTIWKNVIQDFLDLTQPDYVAVEDYSYGSKGQGYQIGEVGGQIRSQCFDKGIRLRLHDPDSIKLFVTGNGHASKDAMVQAVSEKWEVDFSQYNPPRKSGKKQNTEISEDLSDAFGLAKLLWAEIQLRSGNLALNALPVHELQVFNRTTKTFPLNILGRNWIYCEGDNL